MNNFSFMVALGVNVVSLGLSVESCVIFFPGEKQGSCTIDSHHLIG